MKKFLRLLALMAGSFAVGCILFGILTLWGLRDEEGDPDYDC